MTGIWRMLAVGVVLSGITLAGCGQAARTGTPPPVPTSSPARAPTSVVPTTSPRGPAGTPSPPVTVAVHVWFLNEDHAVTGEQPLYEPVDRRVPPPALAAGALDALFAGPTAAEQAGGLRLITSGATGYSRLHIQDTVAYVTLEGGCATNGSTMTIAGEIMPTLKQFASVTYVKIFAPDGTTETPGGLSDSVPTCLEP